jgi:hypothetical protein
MFYDHEEDRLATPTEACREYARNVGAEQPDRAWILTDYDTWERNPFYHGPPAPHPEDDFGPEDEVACEFRPEPLPALPWPPPAVEIPF